MITKLAFSFHQESLWFYRGPFERQTCYSIVFICTVLTTSELPCFLLYLLHNYIIACLCLLLFFYVDVCLLLAHFKTSSHNNLNIIWTLIDEMWYQVLARNRAVVRWALLCHWIPWAGYLTSLCFIPGNHNRQGMRRVTSLIINYINI